MNRRSNEVPRTAFEPRELADLTVSFYRRNYIEGLFLSSGVVRNPDYTTELIIRALEILRREYRFRGYIHAKAIPGTSPELIERLGHLCDRLSVNMELPSSESLAKLAPDKTKHSIIAPMRQIKDSIASDRDTRALMRKNLHYNLHVTVPKKERAFAPAGQSTQMIIGATPESDYRILNTTSALYRKLGLKRVFYSAYLPVGDSRLLPGENSRIQLDREHRLFQADWLLRFYGFDVNEIIDADHPFLDPRIDPKANWAVNHLEFFPIEVNTASKQELLRVPGIGAKGVRSIMKARRTTTLGPEELKRLGIAYKRARFFITCNGRFQGTGISWTPEALKAQLSAPIQGGTSRPPCGARSEGAAVAVRFGPHDRRRLNIPGQHNEIEDPANAGMDRSGCLCGSAKRTAHGNPKGSDFTMSRQQKGAIAPAHRTAAPQTRLAIPLDAAAEGAAYVYDGSVEGLPIGHIRGSSST